MINTYLRGRIAVMTSDSNALPNGFYEYESLTDALEYARLHYSDSGVTDLYSTGYPLLDKYMGGGFGKRDSYEIMLIHSQSKMMKSTLAVSMMMDSFSKGHKQGWIILEGTFGEAIIRARRCASDYVKFDKMMANAAALENSCDQQLFFMSTKMTNEDYTLVNILQWIEHLNDVAGVSLFFIDPIGYAFDFSVHDKYENEWSRQAKFMQKLSRLCSSRNLTVVMIQHNTKDNDKTKTFRDAAIGGSSTLAKAATKVIEIRREKFVEDKIMGWHSIMSIEMYMSRHSKDYKYHPIIMKVYDKPDKKGTQLFFPTFPDGDKANEQLNHKCGDVDRSVWWGQITDN